MKVKACIYTDAGNARKNNQDASLIKVANTRLHGRITLIAMCDGMGGLSKGEVASCKAIRALETWFHEELFLLQSLSGSELWAAIEDSWIRMAHRIDGDLRRYGKHRGLKLGTTMTALLQIGKRYISMNIGDSRIYFVRGKKVAQITKDQSVVQDKIDRGIITPGQALFDEQKSVLLQCLGTGGELEPEIKMGVFEGNTTVIACSDGFWRTMEQEELRQKLCPQMCLTDEDMLTECKKLANYAISRGENDNISLACACLEF